MRCSCYRIFHGIIVSIMGMALLSSENVSLQYEDEVYYTLLDRGVRERAV